MAMATKMTRAWVWIAVAAMLLACRVGEASRFGRDRRIEFGGGKPVSSLVGGWSAIDPKDPNVVTLAKFAVHEHNKKLSGHGTLLYSKLVEAKSQVVSGVMYLLTVEATDSKNSVCSYEAKVWVKEWENFRRLMSFDPVTKS
ncbi:cysteine proteinase inhibitor A [Selaginella moellendorffii]|nr:cysteine proteinase inhibitor A [Selaginella moellendorffii]|eukprot:XP_002976277.2 cysteine proteinase inhibitor A [Selaginella moellendorffii]